MPPCPREVKPSTLWHACRQATLDPARADIAATPFVAPDSARRCDRRSAGADAGRLPASARAHRRMEDGARRLARRRVTASGEADRVAPGVARAGGARNPDRA